MTITNEVLTLSTTNIRKGADGGAGLRLSVWPRSPYGNGSQAPESDIGRIYDSYTGNTSTATRELLQDENRRQPCGPDAPGSTCTPASSDFDTCPTETGQWNEQTVLVNTHLVMRNDELKYGAVDWSTGHTPAGNPDYSGFTGDQYYYRAFSDSGSSHSSGQIELDGLLDADIEDIGTASNVHVEMKLCDGETGWLDLGCPFDGGSFTGIDGDCIQTAQSGDLWSWSVGSKSTGNSSDMYILKITFESGAKDINEIEEVGW